MSQMENTAVAREAQSIPHIDAHFNKFSQSWVVALTALAFIFNLPVLLYIAAVCLLISAIAPAASPFRLLYKGVVLPLHLLRPRIVEDDPAPHRFAQGVGATFLVVASLVFLFTRATTLGWVLDVIVFVLASLNLFVGFCAGCFVYYHLGRLGVLPRVRYEGGFHWRGV